jgi:hypothetical protein
MSGIFERIASLSGTELAKATNLAHSTYQERLAEHGHSGRALVETVAHVCRNHPNLIGIGVGLLVEHLLHEEKRKYEAEHGPDAPAGATTPPPPPHEIKSGHLPHHQIRLSTLKPAKIAWEVFGGLILLKLASTGVKLFRHKRQGEPWFESAARIHLISGSLATFHIAKALKSREVSAWRNAWAALFLTDALKPMLNGDPKRIAAVAKARREAAKQEAARAQAPAAPTPLPAPEPQPQAAPAPYDHAAQAAPSAPAAPFVGQGHISQPVSIGDPAAVEQPAQAQSQVLGRPA